MWPPLGLVVGLSVNMRRLAYHTMLLRGHYVTRLLIALCLAGVPPTNGFEISGGSAIEECHTVDFFVGFKCRKLVWHVE
jgi:hypothetical protein